MIEAAPSGLPALPGRNIADRIASLTMIETHLGLGQQFGRTPQRFRQLGRLFVSDRHLSRDLLRRCSLNRNGTELPRLSKVSVLTLLHSRFAGAAYEWPVGTDAVLFAANMRGFYASPHRLTVKVKGPERSIAEFREDVHARQRVAESGLIDVPAVLDANLTAAQPYIVDQFVCGQRAHWFKHRAILLGELVPGFWDMYQAFGTTNDSCEDWFDTEAIAEELRALPLDATSIEELRCRRLLVRLASSIASQRDKALVWALGHGDLSVGNLIVKPNARLCVVDWELSRRQPIAWDFRKVLLHVPGVWEPLCTLLEAEVRRRGWSDVLQPRRQLLLALCAYVADWNPLNRAFNGSAAAPRRRPEQIRAMLRSAYRVIGECFLPFEPTGSDHGTAD